MIMPLISRTDMSAFLHSFPSQTMALTLSRPGLELCSHGMCPCRYRWEHLGAGLQRPVWDVCLPDLMERIISVFFLGRRTDGRPSTFPFWKNISVSTSRLFQGLRRIPGWSLTCLGGAGRPALGAVQEVFPHQVLRLGLVSGALGVVRPQTGTSGAAAGARLWHVLAARAG